MSQHGGTAAHPDYNLPMRFAICNEIFQGWPLQDMLAHAARLGYAGVEIAPFTLADSVTDISAGERQKIREAAARNRIAIAGIHWVLVKPEGLYINHPDRSLRERTAAYFCDLVDFCADLGGKVMVVGSPKQRNLLPGVSPAEGCDWAAATFRQAVARAEQRGVIICFEPLAPAETNFINTAAEALQFVQQLPSPHFKIILDVKAMCSESKPIRDIIRESWPHFAHFHAQTDRCRLEGGELRRFRIGGGVQVRGRRGGNRKQKPGILAARVCVGGAVHECA
jgi:sugar phosphate isomerase/epimerase